jgi:RHS repeat-associated protein
MKLSFSQLTLALFLGILAPRLSLAIGNDNPTGMTGEYNGNVTTAGSYDPYTGNAKRAIEDLTVTGSVGAYPLKWTRFLNTRGFGSAFGHGGSWDHSYHWGIWVQRPEPPCCYFPTPYEGPAGMLTMPDGREIALATDGGGTYWIADEPNEPLGQLVNYPTTGTFDFVMPDGGKVEFTHPAGSMSGYNLRATAIVDPYGLRTTIAYDTQGRFSKITEPAGRYLQINYTTITWAYGNGTHSADVIDNVQAWDRINGNVVETVRYHYQVEYVTGIMVVCYLNLMSVDYDDGSHAYYTYYPGGTSTNNPWSICSGRMKTCNDVRFAGPMKKIQYEYLSRPEQFDAGWGQIKREKTFDGQTVLSEMEYPPYHWGQVTPGWRKETRPDGSVRIFNYDCSELASYTDFAGPTATPHTSTIQFQGSGHPDTYLKVLTDARTYQTKIEKSLTTGAVMSIKRENSPPVVFEYAGQVNPYYVTSKKDERENATHYARYATGNPHANMIQRVDYPDGGYEEFDYNSLGQVTWHRMTSGGIEEFAYDARGLKQTYTPPWTPSDMTPANNPTRYFYYDATNSGDNSVRIDRLWYVQDPIGHRTWYDYDKRGNVTRITYDNGSGGLGAFTQSHYNPDGTLEWTEDELTHRTTYTYDDYKRVTEVKNALNKIITNDYTPLSGGLSALSHTTSSAYHVTSHMGKVTENDYDRNSRRTRMTVGSGADAATTTYGYDEVGNLNWMKDPNSQGTERRTNYEYDDHNRRKKVTDPLGHWTEWVYDPAGNVEEEKRMDGHSVTFPLYDEMNRPKQREDERQHLSYMDYDAAGNLQTQTDERGKAYSYDYDFLNRKTRVTYPGGSSHEDYLYDSAGRLFNYTNRSRVVQTFVYDQRNRQTDFGWNDGSTSWQHSVYDAASRLEQVTNNISTINYTYFEDNRLRTEETFSNLGGGNAHRTVIYTYDDDGNRQSVQYPDTAVFTYEYTNRGQLKEIEATGQPEPVVSYSYDPNGNITDVTRDNQTSTVQTPDGANRITSIVHNFVAGTAKSFEYAYNNVNNVTAVRRDGSLGDGFEYDESRQIKGFKQNGTVALPGGEVTNPANYVTIGFDPSGNRTTLSQSNPPAGSYPFYNYTPNDLNQYVAVNGTTSAAPTPTPPITPTPAPTATPSPTASPVQTPTPPPSTPTPPPSQQVEAPVFNPSGGPYSGTSVAVGVFTATSGAQIRWTNDNIDPTTTYGTLVGQSGGANGSGQYSITLKAIAFKSGMNPSDVTVAEYWHDGEGGGNSQNSAGIGYDGNGNLTHYKGWAYAYDAQNRLTGATNGAHTAEFSYDAKNRQIKRTIDGVTRFNVWDDWELIEEYDTSNVRRAEYLQGAHGVIRSLVNNRYYYYYQDSLGSTTHVAGADGQLMESYRYDLYGTPSYYDESGNLITPQSSNIGVSDLYAGERWASELGLYDLRNRFMSPDVGRFLQPDPIGFKGDAGNLYRYCHNDPVDFSDPSGLFDLWGHLRWFFSASTKSFADWEKDRQLDTIQFSGVVSETGLGGGNWKDKNVGNHAVEDNQMTPNHSGGTIYDVKGDAQGDGSLVVISNLNWRVAKSDQNTKVVTVEVGDHVRSYRVAETDKHGRIRVALDAFEKSKFHGTVVEAADRLNDKLGKAKANEDGAQRQQFHGGGIYWNSHAKDKNPELLKPITAQDIERVMKTVPGMP